MGGEWVVRESRGEGRGGKSRDKMTRFFLTGPIGRASVVLGPTWSLWPPYRWSVFRAILHGSQYIQGRERESVSLSSHANLFCILRTHTKKRFIKKQMCSPAVEDTALMPVPRACAALKRDL